MSSSTNQTVMALNSEQQKKYQCLCIVLQAVNETCKVRKDIRYSSGSSCSDASLTDFQKLLCKMAQILDSEKGGNCATALVALQGPGGPDYVFSSNLRSEPELERVKSFFSELLRYVGGQPADYNPKAVQRQVLVRILDFNYPRLEMYLNGLPGRLDDIAQLQALKDRAQFPRDMTSSINARQMFHSNCEDLIRAIQKAKSDKIDNVFDKYIGNTEPELSYDWCQLRHHLGRLHSLRQASEAIVQALKEWPKLFKDFTVNYVKSSRPKRFNLPRGLHAPPEEIIKAAFPEYETAYYEGDIDELRRYGLYAEIQKQEQEFPSKAQVHCEVNLHDYLKKIGKNRPCDFWEGVMFIATSKPPCRLCYYYFEEAVHDFRVQPSHMNLYSKWRLPDVETGDDAATDYYTELIEDIFERMQEDTLKILQNKFPQWKRNDSRTESRNWPGNIRDGVTSRTPLDGYHVPQVSDIEDDDSYATDMETETFGIAISD
ncbi:hypothetical protein ACLX1H_008194 [Fusarium chlamydosporum]